MQDTSLKDVVEAMGGSQRLSVSKLESGLGAWASAVSADDNAQAAIALAEAINRARTRQSAQETTAIDGRTAAVARLESLRARLLPVYAAIPRDVESFDLGIVGQNPPRLFVDIIAFVETTGDGRGYRLMQDTRAGRVLIGETDDPQRMTDLVVDYIAMRLVERERALASAVAPRATTAGRSDVGPAAAAVQAPVAAPASAVSTTSSAAMPAIADPAVQLSETPPSPIAAAAAAAISAASTVRREATIEDTAQPSAASTGFAVRNPAAARTTPAQSSPARSSGGWFWPILALLLGLGLGALGLYLYAATLPRP